VEEFKGAFLDGILGGEMLLSILFLLFVCLVSRLLEVVAASPSLIRKWKAF
jgi:hypothetical protein